MSIACAILGLLSREPMAGYDLKKIIQDSPLLPWSGNNNQVYRALTALLEDGLVTGETLHQDGLPSRKVYTLTAAGRAALLDWAGQPPEPMELRKPLLVQLQWAGGLGKRRVDALLEAYERQLRMQLGRHAARQQRGDALDAALAALVEDNIAQSFRMELDWARRAREVIAQIEEPARGPEGAHPAEGEAVMGYQVMERNGMRYLRYRAGAARPDSVEATQFVADCMEHQLNRVLIEERALPEAFFRLSTGVAGEMMQKLAQYHVKAALLIDEQAVKGKFKEMLAETNRGAMFRSFAQPDAAERWLAGEGGA